MYLKNRSHAFSTYTLKLAETIVIISLNWTEVKKLLLTAYCNDYAHVDFVITFMHVILATLLISDWLID